jgi:hypothetical protein
MNKYSIVDSNQRMIRMFAESIRRDGDWLELTKSIPQTEARKINYPEEVATVEKPGRPARVETVMVETGRFVQAPVAMFYKPISCEMVSAEEPSNGNDA